MALIHAYLRFDGNAREAFEFYQKCLGGELTITTVGNSPMAQYMPEKQDHVFHAQLHYGDMVLLGSDMVGEEGLTKGTTMVLTLECVSKAEAETLFTRLSEGGKVGHPLTEQPFGGIGDFADKFGVDWFVVFMITAPNSIRK
jgi:PhnB protein